MSYIEKNLLQYQNKWVLFSSTENMAYIKLNLNENFVDVHKTNCLVARIKADEARKLL